MFVIFECIISIIFMQDKKLITYFTDPLLFSYIIDFLTIRQKLAVTTLNKEIRYIMEDHFKVVLHENKLHLISNKSTIHQMRFYFDRILRIFKHQKQLQTKQETKQSKKKKEFTQQENNIQQILKLTIENPFKFKVITYFEVGPIYIGFLDNQGRAYIFRTSQVLSLIESKQKPSYLVKSEVKDISCKGEKFYFLRNNGEVCMWQTDKKQKDICLRTQDLLWSIHIPIKNIYCSFNYTIYILENPHQSRYHLMNQLFNYHNLNEIQKCQQDPNQHNYYLIASSASTNFHYLVKLKAENVISVAVGHKEAYLVNQLHQCYIIQFQHINQGVRQLTAKKYQPLDQKQIMKVASGYNYYLALQRNIQYIEEWTNEKVIVWLRDIGFGDYIKIAKAQKIDGSKLKNMERKFMENVLGITKLNMQQKFILCIEEVIEGKNQYDQIWVWGKNQHGQLGVSHANYIAHPLRIKMEFLKGNDRIDNIFCGWFQTFIRTHRGKIYSSIITSEKKKKREIEQKQTFSDEEDIKESSKEQFKYKNNRRKKTEDFYKQQNKKIKKQHHKKFQQEQRWVESNAGKAFFVQTYKEYIFFIQCPGQNKFQPTKQKKLRTSKAIIDRILWDNSLAKQQFKIGIIDKQMGTIEVSLYQIQMFDYKQSSIRYVKRNNIIVWDRQNKIDHL